MTEDEQYAKQQENARLDAAKEIEQLEARRADQPALAGADDVIPPMSANKAEPVARRKSRKKPLA